MSETPFDSLADALRDRYVLERELGRGGMATVYLAMDRRHGRPVAIKVLHDEIAGALGPERFLREIAISSRLQNPHILPLFESGTAAIGSGSARPYYVMPYIAGESLRERLDRKTQLELEEALGICRQVAAALSYAHGQGIVHRDIKPGNILLEDGRALVADFGIAQALDLAGGAKLTATGLSLGTPAYMSPEQAAAGRVDARADIYSLACVLYEMLAGTPPFTGATPRAIMARHALDPVPPLRTARPGIPAQLEAVLQRALAKVPADRFGTAAEFVRALDSERLLGGQQLDDLGERWAPVMATILSEPLARRRRMSRIGFVAMVAILSLVIGVLTLRSLGRRAPVKPPDPNLVAVAPFRVTAADPALAYLREGMLDLLAARLTGQGGPRASDPRAVLSAWRRAAGSDVAEVPQDRAIELAERLGAGQLIVGNVVGAPGRVTLNAIVLTVPDGRNRAAASVDGPADSLPNLVDQLATRLLTLGAQEGEQRLTALTSTSLPALRLYLDGQALYRRGKYQQSTVLFGRALDLDSTFALAALGLLASSYRTGDWELSYRGVRLAGATRGRLNARDQAYLRSIEGMAYGDTIPYSGMLQRAEDFVAVAPDRVEAYVGLGEVLFSYGPMLFGIERAHERSAAAYRTALEMDSTYAPALDNTLLLAARAGDTATVRRVDRLYRAIDPVAGLPVPLHWRAAVALKDSAELKRVRAMFDTASSLSLLLIGEFSQYDGVSLEDGELAYHTSLKHESRGEYRNAAFVELGTLALNRGRPAEALGFRQQEATFRGNEWANMTRVLDALYWDGDSIAARAAMRDLESYPRGAPRNDLRCVTEQWSLAHGRSTTVRASIADMRNVSQGDERWRMLSRGCATLLDAMLAAVEKRPDADAALGRLDSLMQSGPPYRLYHQSWNLVVARLKEDRGDVAGALAATRRRLYYSEPMYLSTYLREEGRLAALTGDRVGAIRAYAHFLSLRANPEPRLRPKVEQVRAELAELVKQLARRNQGWRPSAELVRELAHPTLKP